MAAFGILQWLNAGFSEVRADHERHGHVVGDIRALDRQLETYKSRTGAYPTSLGSLAKERPKDPWRHDYVYKDPGIKRPHGFDLFSAGPDSIPDTPDDDWGE